MSDNEQPEFNYDTLNKRIKQAKNNPLYGLSKDDLKDYTTLWLNSFTQLQNPNRRKISENHNYRELLNIITKYPHRKTNPGYLVYLDNVTISILGGDGAFCDEMTYEVAILNNNNEFITQKYDQVLDSYQMSLAFQDLEDIEKIIAWGKEYKD